MAWECPQGLGEGSTWEGPGEGPDCRPGAMAQDAGVAGNAQRLDLAVPTQRPRDGMK